jgi:hypothetical protein
MARGRTSILERGLQFVVQLGERRGPLVEWLVLDHAEPRKQRIRLRHVT